MSHVCLRVLRCARMDGCLHVVTGEAAEFSAQRARFGSGCRSGPGGAPHRDGVGKRHAGRTERRPTGRLPPTVGRRVILTCATGLPREKLRPAQLRSLRAPSARRQGRCFEQPPRCSPGPGRGPPWMPRRLSSRGSRRPVRPPRDPTAGPSSPDGPGVPCEATTASTVETRAIRLAA